MEDMGNYGYTLFRTIPTVLKLPKQQQLWGILRFHLFLEELPSGFCLQFHVRDAWLWNI